MSVTVPTSWGQVPRYTHHPVWTVVARTEAGASLVLPIAGEDPGQLVKDAGTYPRTTLDVQVPEKYLNPHTVSDVLMPFTTTVTASFGYTDPTSGVTASVVVATLRLIQTTAERPGGALSLSCVDLSSIVEGNPTPLDTTYAGGTTLVASIVTAVTNALAGRAPVLVNQLTAAQNAMLVPTAYSWQGPPWSSHVEPACDLLGAEAFFDAAGRLVLRPVPVKAGSALYTLTSGDGGVLTGMRSTVERAPNAVSLVYDRAGTPVVGAWVDTRPGSPTAVAGGYLVRRIVEDRKGRPSAADADNAAKAYAQRVVGRVRTVEYRAVPVPWLEPGDTIGVEPVDKGPTELHVVQSVNLPLNHDPMTVTTRDAAYVGPI